MWKRGLSPFPHAENKNNIRWNFTKFLISTDGKVLKRFEPGDKMTDVDAAVAQAHKTDK